MSDKECLDEKSPLKQGKNAYANDFIPRELLHHCNDDMDIDTNDRELDSLFGWDGMILSAPMVKIKETIAPPNWLTKIGKLFVPLLPEARVVPSKSLIDKLTRDEAYFEFVKQSPMLYDDKPALRTGFVLLAFTKHIESELHRVQLPVLIMHGEKDEITDPDMSRLFYDTCASTDKTIKIFEGAFHALLIETCRNQVFEEVDRWISQRNSLREE